VIQAKADVFKFRRIRVWLLAFFAVIMFTLSLSLGVVYLLKSSPNTLAFVLEKLGSWALGRELYIGELKEAELAWDTYLVATDVTLANPEWAENANFVRVGQLRVRINLPSIWRKGPLIIDELDLADVSVELLGAGEHPANWTFWPDRSEANTPDVVAGGVDIIFPFIIREGHIETGTLSYWIQTRTLSLPPTSSHYRNPMIRP